MEGNESFVFIAQSKEVDMGEEQDLRAKVNPLEKSTSSSLKRARSNQDVEERAPNSYGPWLTVTYNKNNKIINSQRNIKFEGRTERDNMEGYRVKETKRSNAKLKDKLKNDAVEFGKKRKENSKQIGKQSKGGVSKGKAIFSVVDTAGQGTKEKKTNYSSKGGIFQYQVKEPPDMVIEEDNTMDETWVIQQLHKDIASFEGNKKPSSREYEEGDDTMLEK
ncbi:hypothetical protein ACOSQ4_022701 [Xanthoceras sorbifolium]